MRRIPIIALVIPLAIGIVGSAHAAIMTFSGADNGAAACHPPPCVNSDAAAASFDAAAGAHGLITFEGLPLGPFVSMGVAPGVTVTLTGAEAGSGGIQNTNQHAPTPIGFNTTAGGTEWLQAFPNFNSPGETLTFTFASPIDAFGGYLTDTQVGFPGSITVTFNDGSSQSLPVTKNDDTGGAVFFGFTDLGAQIASVTYNTGATGATRDIWGIDDVRFAVPAPEPASLALLVTGLIGLGIVGRRRRAA
jgi:hypothetical protein